MRDVPTTGRGINMPKRSRLGRRNQPRIEHGNQPASRSGARWSQRRGRELRGDDAPRKRGEAARTQARKLGRRRSQPRHMGRSVAAMIAIAIVRRCLGVLMHAACRMIGIIECVA